MIGAYEHKYSWSRGLCSSLPEGYDHDVQPDWRLVTFSLIYPAPDKIFPASPELYDDHGFIRFDETAVARDFADAPAAPVFASPKRYQGISAIDFPRHLAAGSESETNRPLYREPHSRFGKVMGKVVSTDSDADDRSHHFTIMRKDQSSLMELAVASADPDDKFATVSLIAVELLQFRDQVDSLPGNVLAGSRDSASAYGVNRYFVLHVAAENCSSATLETISAALNRARNVLKVDVPDGDAVKPLFEFSTRIRHYLSQLSGTYIGLFINRGGYISLPRVVEKDGQLICKDSDVEVSSEELQLMKDLQRTSTSTDTYAVPFRTVAAVANKSTVTPPALLRGVGESDTYCDPHIIRRQWAWVLANGADRYWEAIPVPDLAEAMATGEDFRYWTVLAAETGLAHTRLSGGEKSDLHYWMLASTRRVDLAILTMRSHSALYELSLQLDQLDEYSHAPSGEDLFSNKDAYEKFRKSLEQLTDLQHRVVHFRGRLWFNSVPRRPLDTDVLEWIRRSTGVHSMYEDFLDEIQLRQQIYAIVYQRLEAEYNRQAEDHYRRNEDHQRELAEREQEQDRKTTLIFGIVAIILAVPGFVELLPLDRDTGWPAIMFFVLALFAVIVAWPVYKLADWIIQFIETRILGSDSAPPPAAS